MKIVARHQNVLTAIAAGLLCMAAQNALSQSSSNPMPDNSMSNQLDPSNTSATADAQKDNLNDRTITQRIRQGVMADKSLSTYAHNVKIVAVDSNVTLNGVVRSDEEKSTVEAKAVAVVGQSRVVNDLKVSPKL